MMSGQRDRNLLFLWVIILLEALELRIARGANT